LLEQIPHGEVRRQKITLPKRVHNPDYSRGPVPKELYVPAVY
jgi:hypothetical protein